MLKNITVEKLSQLKLSGMAKGYAQQQESSTYTSMSFDERLGLLVDQEATERENRRYERLVRQAKL